MAHATIDPSLKKKVFRAKGSQTKNRMHTTNPIEIDLITLLQGLGEILDSDNLAYFTNPHACIN